MFYSHATLKLTYVSERFFRTARSRSESVAALRRAESDAAVRKKIRSHEPIFEWYDYILLNELEVGNRALMTFIAALQDQS